MKVGNVKSQLKNNAQSFKKRETVDYERLKKNQLTLVELADISLKDLAICVNYELILKGNIENKTESHESRSIYSLLRQEEEKKSQKIKKDLE